MGSPAQPDHVNPEPKGPPDTMPLPDPNKPADEGQHDTTTTDPTYKEPPRGGNTPTTH